MDRINQLLRKVPTTVIWVAGAFPFVWLIYLTVINNLGPDPVKAIELKLGLWGLQFLIASLAITPLRKIGLNLIRYRRAIGVYAFIYIAAHFLAWMVLDMGLRMDEVVNDLTKRPYIIIGMIGLASLFPLAITSTNAAIKRLGPVRWKKLHRLTYVAGIAGTLHFIILVKGWQTEPLIYGFVLILLLFARLQAWRPALA